VSRRNSVPLVLLLSLVLVTSGCLQDDDDGNGDGSGPPPVGTTEGFTFPDFQFSDDTGVVRESTSWGGDFTIVHVIGSTDDVFEPQFAQIRSVLGHFDNVTVRALTITSGNDTRQEMDAMAEGLDVTWTTGLPLTDLADELSLVRPMTVFLLDGDHVILLRSDDMLGEGRIVQAIEATWGIEPPEDTYPQVGSTVPDLVWRDIDGNEGSLSDLEGSPVLLNVWEMECPFCMELFVQLEKVWGNYSDEGLQMVSIDLITWETEAQVRGVREEYNATWTFAIDGDNIQSRYDIWNLPLLVLLDGDGVVQWVWTGYIHSSVISGEVEKLI
jgi:peroxiredoxin